MRRKMVVASLAILLAVALAYGHPTRAAVTSVGSVELTGGLEFSTPFTLAPDGRFFYGERFSGEVRIFDPSNGSNTLFFTIPDITQDGTRGLVGMELALGYPATPFVYAYATRDVSGVPRQQIVRMTDDGGVGSNLTVIWSGNFVAGAGHPGGPIKFGPDGTLYATVGDSQLSANSQDLSSEAGKFLRMRASGAVPPDNPFAGSRVWSYGLRSSFGFDFDPQTGNIWTTENGPDCNDEVNRIQKGGNFGWGPNATCNQPPPAPKNTNRDGPSPIRPQIFFSPTIAPTGLAFCAGCGISSLEGSFVFGAFNDHVLRKCTLDPTRKRIISTTPVYTHWDSILSVERGPDGTIYLNDFQGIWKLIEI